MVELLALAHDRGCEADLAAALVEQLADGSMPDLAPLRARFARTAANHHPRAPDVAAPDGPTFDHSGVISGQALRPTQGGSESRRNERGML